MRRLEDYLHDDAINYPNKIAILSGSYSITYSELYTKVCDQAELYIKSDISAVVERSSQDINFLVKYFGAHIAGKAFIPVEKNIPEKKINELTELINQSEISSDIADILFTTGTTGRQKGTMISHNALIANAENLIYAQRYSHETVFIISGPLNHIGSLSKVWPIIVLGGTIIITDGIKDMKMFFTTFNYPSSKFATFLVPASLRMLMELGEDELGKISEKIDFIETGAAPINQNDMEKLCAILPHTRLYNTYASTETGIISTHDFSQGYCVPGCLGRCMKNAEIVITETGTISCKGPMIMSGYLGDNGLTQAVLRNGMVYTADLGYLDKEERLFLQGRKDDIINVGGFKVSPIEIEDIALAFKGIKDCICIGTVHPIMGNVLKLIYSTIDGSLIDKKNLIKHFKAHLESYKIPLYYEQNDIIVRTYNGKIDRKHYNK